MTKFMKTYCRIIPAALLLVSITGFAASAQTRTARHFQVKKLSEGVYAAIHTVGGYAICNAGIVDLGDQTLIFDTFLSPEAARDLRRMAEALTDNPVTYVVNSHYHNDHIRGNQVFTPDAVIISTKWTRTAIAEHEPRNIAAEKEYAPKQLKMIKALLTEAKEPHRRKALTMWLGYYEAMIASNPVLETTLPSLTFDRKMTLHGKERNIELIAFNRGHTGSDVVLYLPDEQIIFTGDLVFIENHPWLSDGYPHKWIAVLEQIQAMKIKKLVPGHGPVGDAEDLEVMIEYIDTVEGIARRMIAEGTPIEAASNMSPTAPYDQWWLKNFFSPNVKFMYERAVEEGKTQ